MRSSPILAAMLSALAATSFAAVAQAAPLGPAPAMIYQLAKTVPLPGKAPGWDYLSLDPLSGRLFIGRRADGVSVYDTRRGKLVTTIARSQKANGAVAVPEFDRGYTANGDGSTTVFALSTLKTLARVKLGDSADAAFYDPFSKRVIITRGDDHRLSFVDARTGKPVGELKLDSDQLEGVAVDGRGGVFVAERDKNSVAKIDPVRLTLVTEWPIGRGCVSPTGAAMDAASHRLFLGCKGEKPVLAVMDTASGRTVAAPPIGRGNDGVAFDTATKQVFTSNGVDGNIVIYDQLSPDDYRLDQAVTTRPIARTMAYDPATRTIYTAAAEGIVDPSRPINTRAASFYPNAYFDDSFKLFVFKPHAYKPAAPAED